MGLFTKPEEATQPLTPEVQEPTVEEDVVQEQTEDRAAFNCTSCNGEGLVFHVGANRFERCPVCSGTGKVS
jgi:DnaJ-class molecular chaperone